MLILNKFQDLGNQSSCSLWICVILLMPTYQSFRSQQIATVSKDYLDKYLHNVLLSQIWLIYFQSTLKIVMKG